MKKLFILSLSALLCLYACKKEDTSPIPEVYQTKDYFYPLKPGSYWIYDNVTKGQVDSVSIVKDSTFNGRQYFYILSTMDFEVSEGWYTDSAGYVINEWGDIIERNDGSRDTIVQYGVGVGRSIEMAGSRDTSIQTAAGTFATLETIHQFSYDISFNVPSGVTNPRYIYEYSSRGVGMIKRSIMNVMNNNPHQVFELRSYYIAQ